MIERVKLDNFTVFKSLDVNFSPGVNIIIGENGTGKTHLLKLLYTPLSALRKEEGKKEVRISDKLIKVFLPKEKRLGRLVRRQPGSSTARVQIWRNSKKLNLTFSNHTKDTLQWNKGWSDSEIPPVTFIPAKEMLANAPNFRSLYDEYDLSFEEVYYDIVTKSLLPLKRGPADKIRKRLLSMIQKAIQGKIINKEEQFYLKNKQGELEFTLLAEGMRKLGLLWILIQNGMLQEGAVLFWDEPEANLNPKLMRIVVEILLELQKSVGVQIFVTTHSYTILKEFDLQSTRKHEVAYYALYRDEEQDIQCSKEDNYRSLEPNAISEHFDRIYDLEIKRKFGEGR